MKIVSSLVSQIGGQAIFGANPSGQGARFTVRFTLNERPDSVAESPAPKSVLSGLGLSPDSCISKHAPHVSGM